MMKNALFCLLVLGFIKSYAQPAHSLVLPLQKQAEVIDAWTNERLQTLLPELMRREGIDMWLIIAREYNEDPVIETMLPATWLAARRRTILLIYDPGQGKALETLAVARYDVGKSFKKAWNPEEQPDQWLRLRELIVERSPKRIALNRSSAYGHADGLSATEYEAFVNILPKDYPSKLVSGEKLAVGWLETRTPTEMAVYPHIVRIAHEIIAEGFSESVVQPGITTTTDVEWWYRERIRSMGLETWFHPSVSVQRPSDDSKESQRAFSSRPASEIIQPGDLLHVDFGITYLRLNTDTQQHAYVLKAGEKDAPEYLKRALAIGNRLQDILTLQFRTGKTGNEMLAAARKQAQAEGIVPSIYTHPIGYHGHGAGPAIGMWDMQQGVPFTGEYPLYPNTAYSIELNATVQIPEWNKAVRIMLEEDAYFDGSSIWYIDGRQTEFLLIPRREGVNN